MATLAAHPIDGAVARVHSVLDEVAEVPSWSMGQEVTARVLVEIARVESRLVELRSRALAHAQTVGVQERDASPSVAVWRANATRSTKRESFREVWVAEGLAMGMSNSHEMSYRQLVTPDELQARTNTTLRSLNRAVVVLVAPVAGLLADAVGMQTMLVVAAVAFGAVAVGLASTPFRTVRAPT